MIWLWLRCYQAKLGSAVGHWLSCSEHTILASNTSVLVISTIAVKGYRHALYESDGGDKEVGVILGSTTEIHKLPIGRELLGIKAMVIDKRQ